MKYKLLELLACPECSGNIKLQDGYIKKNEEVWSGTLLCEACPQRYPIINFIPRFVETEGYASNFSYEFKLHSRTQIDKFSGNSTSSNRFLLETGWGKDMLAGKLVLEAGCGAGRFSQAPLESGAELISIDLSEAVDVALENHGLSEKHHLIQADLFNLPLKRKSFDHVFCLGVLQHTPHPKAAFLGLIEFLKPGGKIAVNIYQSTPLYMIQPKYLLRWITKRMDKNFLYRICHKITPPLMRVGFKLFDLKLPLIHHYLKQFIPDRSELDIPYEQLEQWGILCVFDMLSPEYDKPITLKEGNDWLTQSGLIETYSRHGIVLRGSTKNP